MRAARLFSGNQYQLLTQSLSVADRYMNLASTPTLRISIVIPVYRGGDAFRRCLSSLVPFIATGGEVIVVVDGNDAESERIAKVFTPKVIRLAQNYGPATARNRGAAIAERDLLFFLDADVSIAHDTLERAVHCFDSQPQVDALIGSYDDAPGAPNFLSQYKNLFHHYNHQTANREASTFWGACGIIRRSVFWAVGGFDESYRVPCVEDIELGYRLKRAGHHIWLDRSIQVKHLKHWGVRSLLKADFCDRALPWTELLWRDRQFVNDLNLQTSSRLSIIAVYGLIFSLIFSLGWASAIGLALGLVISLLVLNAPVYQFFWQLRGGWFTLRVIPWHWLYYIYGGLAFAIGTVRYGLQYRQQSWQLHLALRSK